jgi:L-gulonolactone oxidase
MHAAVDTAPLDAVIEGLDGYVRGHDHFKLWWLAPSDRAVLFLNDRTDRPRDDSDLARWVNDELLSVGLYRALVALGSVDRRRLIPPINRLLTAAAGRRRERTCESRVGFLTPVPPVHREAEWAFDYAGARDLLRAYRALMTGGDHRYSFVQEVRFTRGDDFWMSPGHGRDSIWLSMYNMDSDARWADQLARFEAFAIEHGGRPHWGKEGRLDAGYLAGQYARMGSFREVMRALDPAGKFVNAWAAEVFGEGG